MKSKFDPQKHHRRSIRLKGFDYSSQGAYYITIVSQGRECLFGEIIEGGMYLNQYGEVIQKWWHEIPIHFQNVELGAFVIMPNHVHWIIFITTNNEDLGEVVENSPPYRPTLGQIVAYFKYQSTKEINKTETVITKIWQRNYYEHIIRNEEELQQKTNYILDNPSQWDTDDENPLNS